MSLLYYTNNNYFYFLMNIVSNNKKINYQLNFLLTSIPQRKWLIKKRKTFVLEISKSNTLILQKEKEQEIKVGSFKPHQGMIFPFLFFFPNLGNAFQIIRIK